MSVRGVKKSNLKKKETQEVAKRQRECHCRNKTWHTHTHQKSSIQKNKQIKLFENRQCENVNWFQVNECISRKKTTTKLELAFWVHFTKWMNRIPLLVDIIFRFTILPNLNWFFSSIPISMHIYKGYFNLKFRSTLRSHHWYTYTLDMDAFCWNWSELDVNNELFNNWLDIECVIFYVSSSCMHR